MIDGVVRIRVRSYGAAGQELMVELERQAPNIIGLPIELEDGLSRLYAVVLEERLQDGRTTLFCQLGEAPVAHPGQRGSNSA